MLALARQAITLETAGIYQTKCGGGFLYIIRSTKISITTALEDQLTVLRRLGDAGYHSTRKSLELAGILLTR